MMINWNTRRADRELLARIAARATALAEVAGFTYAVRDAEMDVTAAHLNGCRLDLGRLLAADDFNFAHDIFGIRNTLDRTTGHLTGTFWPRFAHREDAV